MTDEAMSPLRRRMIEDMTIRKFAPKTQHDYVQRVKNFAAFLGRSPDTASFDDVPCRRPCGSVLHVFLDVHLVVGGRVDSAVAIDCDGILDAVKTSNAAAMPRSSIASSGA